MTPREAIMRRLEAIAERRGVPMSLIMSDRRYSKVARARWEMWAMLRDDGWSLPRIAAFFDRDHTTVLHGIKAHHSRKSEIDHRMTGYFSPKFIRYLVNSGKKPANKGAAQLSEAA